MLHQNKTVLWIFLSILMASNFDEKYSKFKRMERCKTEKQGERHLIITFSMNNDKNTCLSIA